jgi:hypothetical protein
MGYNEAVQLLKSRRPGATPLPNLDATIQSVLQMRVGGSFSSPNPSRKK